MSLVEDARAKGAQIVEVAPAGAGSDARTRKLPPTLVLDADQTMRIMQEEIFGPLLPVVPYDDIDGAIRFVNRGDRPLAL